MIEALMALALLGLIAATFLGSLGTAARATLIADEQTTAASLALSQMEHIKNSLYIPGDYELITTPDGYSVEVIATPIDPLTGLLSEDLGLQKITVTAKHHGESVVTLESYKVER